MEKTIFNLLIIEDNHDVNSMLREVLINEGYAVDSAYTGIDGLMSFKKNSYDLILLDLMLPYKSGDEVLKEIRKSSEIPVIIISAKDIVGTKIDLLKLGADDYITKPFDLNEVAARVEAQLRRSNKLISTKAITYKDIVLDDKYKKITANGVELELTAKEYQLLELFLKNRSKVFTKANIYETIWQDAYLGDDNAVKTHISNLRSKLKAASPQNEYIETVWGLGYRFKV